MTSQKKSKEEYIEAIQKLEKDYHFYTKYDEAALRRMPIAQLAKIIEQAVGRLKQLQTTAQIASVPEQAVMSKTEILAAIRQALENISVLLSKLEAQ